MNIREIHLARCMGALNSAPYVLLVAAVLAAYTNVYANEFLFDDLGQIAGNKFLTSWHYFGTLFHTSVMQGHGVRDPFFRPLMLVLYLFVYQLTGPSIIAYHLLNVVLHALNACLLYRLGITLRFQRAAALLAAVIWALHPVQTEAITYMSGTADPLCGVFLLSGILVLAEEFSCRRMVAACLLFMLALLSKETAVVFPLLVMGLIFYHSDHRWSLGNYLKTWPYWLITLLYFFLRMYFLDFNGFLNYYDNGYASGATFVERMYTFLATLPVYMRWLVWPAELRLSHSFPVYKTLWTLPTMEGIAILAAAFSCIVWKPSRPATPLAWGILWAISMHIPQSGLLVPSDALLLEHWLYLPTMGLFLAAAESLARFLERIPRRKDQYRIVAVAAILACLFGYMTFKQNKMWRDPVVFYNHIFDCGEDSPKLRNNLGLAYENSGHYEQAIAQYRRALALSDNIAEAHYNLAALMLAMGQGQAGLAICMQHFWRALELNPDFFQVYDEVANLAAYQGDHVKETEYRNKASTIRRSVPAFDDGN